MTEIEGWVRPGFALNINGHAVHTNHRGTADSSNINRVQIAPELRSDETDETLDDDDGRLNATAEGIDNVLYTRERFAEEPDGNQTVQHDPILPVTIVPSMFKEFRSCRTKAQILVDRHKALMDRLPEKKTTQKSQGHSHRATLIDDQGVSQNK